MTNALRRNGFSGGLILATAVKDEVAALGSIAEQKRALRDKRRQKRQREAEKEQRSRITLASDPFQKARPK